MFLYVLGELEKSRITKSGSNVAKGAKAARLQRNKMVGDLNILHSFPMFQCLCAFFYIWAAADTGPETGSHFEREKGFKWIHKPSPGCCEYSLY